MYYKCTLSCKVCHIFMKPCVAGTVLQTPLLFIDPVSHSALSSKSSKYKKNHKP